MRLPRIAGPGFRQRDDDPVRCSHCTATVRRDDLYGLVTARGVYLNVCADCAHRLAPNAQLHTTT